MVVIKGVVSEAAYGINNTEESKQGKTKQTRDHRRKQRALLEGALAVTEIHGKVGYKSFLKARDVS